MVDAEGFEPTTR